MLKIVGALLFISATSFIGMDYSQQLTKRPQQIKMLIQSLRLLEAEMGYSQLPLQQIFYTLSNQLTSPVALFYEGLAKELSMITEDFLIIWDKEVSKLQEQSNLKSSELDILRQFGRHIGHHTFNEQEKHITLTIYYLQHELEEANEIKQKYEKVAKSLGVLIGIFIVLLLF
ncbi:MAG TPA: stage III sporulation protein SpoIIIAB [Pseudogracilibacillus sp.]|nr:stage III sporulation protein SpoIIIAB [Pseudogracilibacillus sp.]